MSLTTLQAINALETAVLAIAWPGTDPPVILPNRSKPTSGEFIELSIVMSSSELRSMGPPGSRSYKMDGQLRLCFYTPLGTGEDRIEQLSGAAQDTLLGNNLGGVRVTERDELGRGEFKTWYYVAVAYNFWYDHHK